MLHTPKNLVACNRLVNHLTTAKLRHQAASTRFNNHETAVALPSVSVQYILCGAQAVLHAGAHSRHELLKRVQHGA